MQSRWAIFFNVATSVLVLGLLVAAQDSKPTQKSPQPSSSSADRTPTDPRPAQEFSGMYGFRRDGEFVQLTVEDDNRVTGFVSRYGDSDSDKDTFLDQFFKNAKLEKNRLTFTTEIVHGGWFDFKGTVERGIGRNPGDEAYFVLKGTLTESNTDAAKKVISRSQEVELKMFSQEAGAAPRN